MKNSRRYYVTVSAVDAERLEAYAASVDRRPTTAAAELLLAGLAAATGEAEEEIADLRRRNHELQDQLDSLGESVRSPEPVYSPPSGPRWEWSVEDLLADRAWWDRWSSGRNNSGPGWGCGHPC